MFNIRENLTSLKNVHEFNNIIEKMTLNQKISEEEVVYILACAIIFLKEYNNDKRKIQHLNFGYFILLKVALNNNYYEPLMDLSLNIGLYPIVRYIVENKLIDNLSIKDIILDANIEKFKKGNIVETYKQKKYREELLNSRSSERSYIAPTSFGKSSFIVEMIKKEKDRKVAIIVPTKSLLLQTYKAMKYNFPKRKIIFHDEMYNNDGNFIAVLTQERLLRLLNKFKDLSFDNLIIDEAHNLLNKEQRSVLLIRAIRRNKFRYPEAKILYLSPLIENSENLKYDSNQNIFERKISFNFKEPDISEYKLNGNVYKYNRFLDEFYLSEKNEDYLNYLLSKSKNKNFVFLVQPKKIENLAQLISERIEEVNDNRELFELSETISKNIHEDFYCVEYIKKGVIYLHGVLPDLIKEYLEHKFSKLSCIRYLVANRVILEGVNLPIDNLYILNTWGLNTKDLINLIGRVNRLNEIFNNKNGSLRKLNPEIHFINNEVFGQKNGNMSNKIQWLRSGLFADEVKNPVLLNCIESTSQELNSSNNEYFFDNSNLLIDRTKEKEDFLILNENDPEVRLRHVLYESGLDSEYEDFDLAYSVLAYRIDKIQNNINWLNADIIDKIYLFFIKDLESKLTNKELSRLKNVKARKFYRMFIERLHTLHLKDHIKVMLKYFYSIREDIDDKIFYVGRAYGEIEHPQEIYKTKKKYSTKNYIDLSTKNHKELVNIALIKIKIESDFVSFSLNKFVNVLYELSLITQPEYNKFMYGNENRKFIEFVQLGLSSSLINFLIRENQIDNIFIDENGYLNYHNEFINFLHKQDDLVQFELSKFITVQ
ncbi:DEAD/DEAH box helicase [Acinetobacter baumannii]|uniref:DEAD/DEAH box helicase n=1 Tax=Acinetobacter baumannii TaxID=470 RepID=UPI00112D44F7|nr:DEAD/DEAH box helicase [Acinetobacter baumannii]MBS4734636.1 DEAD/DEAH box helicase [Acinetobacter baumannii]MCH1772358.1 DEAD/DEAH box helicase [Acinetobacter baumannii]MCQ9992830.1 DEAD/DEAH box helicase [Acinetobacter baumannii]MCR0003706.1 DEAD/DEAH box helicase [Acinetobacter baumannii]QJF38551.1 DEAD/DEAH box helicase [Acinetobacter baumannii]